MRIELYLHRSLLCTLRRARALTILCSYYCTTVSPVCVSVYCVVLHVYYMTTYILLAVAMEYSMTRSVHSVQLHVNTVVH